MLHRCTLWLRRRWDQLPMQLSLLGWPPLLSHGLAFILGTLMLRSGADTLMIPPGKILVPLDKLVQVEAETKALDRQQKLKLVARRGEQWCRGVDEDISLWKPPGRSATTYVLWPSAVAWAPRLEQALQKKLALTTTSAKFAFCGPENAAKASLNPSGIFYD